MTILNLLKIKKQVNTILTPRLLTVLIFLFASKSIVLGQTVLSNDTFDAGEHIWSIENANTEVITASQIANQLNIDSNTCSNLFQNNVVKLNGNGEITSTSLNLSNYNAIIVEYDYFVESLENNEGWFLEFSADNGNSWSIIKHYIYGIDFNNGDCGPNGSGFKAIITFSTNNYSFNTNNKIRLRLEASNSDDYLFVDNIRISGTNASENYWLGYSFNSINDETLWSQGSIPNVNETIVIPVDKHLTITEEVTFFDLNVLGNLNIEKTGSLTVNNDFVNSGSVVMESHNNTFSNLIINGNSNGVIHYDRWVNNFEFNLNTMDIIAPPVSNENIDHFLSNNSNSILNNGTFFAINPFNNGGFGWGDSFIITSESDLIPGNGYAMATPPNNSQTVRFTGNIETGSVNTLLSKSQTAWNVVGNPYTSYLNVNDFLLTNAAAIADEYMAVIGQRNTEDGAVYEYYNLASAYVDNVNIAPGQGFYVAAKNNNAIVNFTPTMRNLHSNNSTSETVTLSSETNKYKLRLNLIKGNEVRYTQFYFFNNNNSSEGFDPGYDANIYDQDNNFNIYSNLLANGNNEKLAIQTLPLNNVEESIIPIGLEAQAGDQLTFSINNIDLPPNTIVWLEDRDSSNWNELTNSSTFTLNVTETISGSGRFYLHFENDTVLSSNEFELNNISIKSIFNTEQILITGDLLETTQVNIYDVNGRLILKTSVDNLASTNRIDVTNINKGVYIIELKNTYQTVSQQVLIQ